MTDILAPMRNSATSAHPPATRQHGTVDGPPATTAAKTTAIGSTARCRHCHGRLFFNGIPGWTHTFGGDATSWLCAPTTLATLAEPAPGTITDPGDIRGDARPSHE